MKIKFFVLIASAFISLIAHFSCTGKQQEHVTTDTVAIVVDPDTVLNEYNTDTVSSDIPRYEDVEPDYNQEILFFSKEGKLLRRIKYYYYPDNRDMPEYLNSIRGFPTSNTIQGDFNGDGAKEKAYFLDRGAEKDSCWSNPNAKSCLGIIRFTDKSIKPLVIQYCPFGQFKNEGDLNDDGRDEIGVLPGWYSSACRSYHVFSFKDSLWKEVCEPIDNSLNMRESGIKFIEKDNTRPGYAIIRQSIQFYNYKNPKFSISDDITITNPCCQYSDVVEDTLKLE